jgi:hypothetical protein
VSRPNPNGYLQKPVIEKLKAIKDRSYAIRKRHEDRCKEIRAEIEAEFGPVDPELQSRFRYYRHGY